MLDTVGSQVDVYRYGRLKGGISLSADPLEHSRNENQTDNTGNVTPQSTSLVIFFSKRTVRLDARAAVVPSHG
jgi:hypothetical protein